MATHIRLLEDELHLLRSQRKEFEEERKRCLEAKHALQASCAKVNETLKCSQKEYAKNLRAKILEKTHELDEFEENLLAEKKKLKVERKEFFAKIQQRARSKRAHEQLREAISARQAEADRKAKHLRLQNKGLQKRVDELAEQLRSYEVALKRNEAELEAMRTEQVTRDTERTRAVRHRAKPPSFSTSAPRRALPNPFSRPAGGTARAAAPVEPFTTAADLLAQLADEEARYVQGARVVEESAASGRTDRRFQSGAVHTVFANGTAKLTLPSADAENIRFENGDVKRTYTDGTAVYFYSAVGTLVTSFRGGGKIVRFQTGQVEHHFADGRVEVRFPDGSCRLFRDAAELARAGRLAEPNF